MSDEIRVLELAEGAAAPFAGRLLASFGATVVKVERPSGDWTRTKPPLVEVDGERAGALFHYLNAGKRSVVVDGDPAALDALWKWADIVLIDESFDGCPDVRHVLDRDGPDVVVWVTPFGLSGPDAGRSGTAATAFARCGEGSITPGGIGFHEFPDAPPLVARGKLADYDAGVMAAMVSIAVLTGGQPSGSTGPVQVDVSVFETEVSNNRWIPSNYERTGWIESRESKPYPFGGMMPCRDGHAMFLPSTDRIWQNFVDIMGQPEWALAEELRTREGRVERADEVRDHIIEWAAGVGKQELLDSGLERGVPLGPYRSMPEVASCPHLDARGFFIEYGDGGASGRVPGLPAPGFVERLATAPRLGSAELEAVVGEPP